MTTLEKNNGFAVQAQGKDIGVCEQGDPRGSIMAPNLEDWWR